MNKYGSKSVAFIINPIDNLDLSTDSTILIANEFQNRGYDLFYLKPSAIIMKNNNIYAEGYYFQIDYPNKSFFNLKSDQVLLDNFDVLFIRQNPPFNQEYLTITYVLENLKNTLVINNPKSIRDVTEKLSILNFKDIIPDTIVSSNLVELKNYIDKHSEVILKPLYDCAGQGVIKLEKSNAGLDNILEAQLLKYGYLMVQVYLPNIKIAGDKRVIFVDGEPLGVINRKTEGEEFRVNMVNGGKPYKTSLSSNEKKLCDKVGKFLKEKNLFLVGIDIIDEKLIEINVTSPTGLIAINNLYDERIEKIIVDKIETKLKN